MKPLRFYEHLACAYGTIWFLMIFASVVSGQKLDTGVMGLVGFPVIALIYAIIRKVTEEKK